MIMQGNKGLPNYVVGSVLLAILAFVLVNQESLPKTNSHIAFQRNEKQLVLQEESEQCTEDSGDFLFSDCTGFYE